MNEPWQTALEAGPRDPTPEAGFLAVEDIAAGTTVRYQVGEPRTAQAWHGGDIRDAYLRLNPRRIRKGEIIYRV